MPIIKKYNLIFIHIPKTAGTSIESALGYKGHIKGDLETWYGNVNNYELDHSTIDYLMQNCKYYHDEYFSFCVVRNPYERLVSEYNYCKRYISRFIKNVGTFKQFVHSLKDKFDFVLKNEVTNHYMVSHYLPQYKFTHINNECKMDMVLKFESLNDDWSKLCAKIGKDIELLKVEKYSSSHSYNYLDYYDDELKEIVYELYKDDFLIFGYDK